MLEEEIQAGYYSFQSWVGGISQSPKEHPDLCAKSSVGFGYHLCSIVARAYLSGSDH